MSIVSLFFIVLIAAFAVIWNDDMRLSDLDTRFRGMSLSLLK